ncbi:hypothetical protein CYMTET_54938 [Cymbomonas tetramitiformis]|uniref:Anaphase-promoting complex subunit CDC26 n=1 Tax=Cymbomonas tetramitiformis TaxID=36881 RepID=A0AAE0BDY1_9CHLO|nr:hypothetical protein CYMTET_54938 [Cymbomonas tetramitiformis]
MLRRKPTRLELKPEDKEEYELQNQLKLQAAAASGKTTVAPKPVRVSYAFNNFYGASWGIAMALYPNIHS